MMESEHWQKIKSILADTLEIAPQSRAAFLEKACQGDPQLKQEIESLLDFEDLDFLEQTAFSFINSNSKPFIGQHIGKYRITGELGTGGMGEVYLAERNDGEFEQKVAVKLIKNGLGSDFLLRRFLNERHILAALKHPNIAYLIDGGTTDDGSPFLVMEYVEGEPITEYAAANNLNLEQRLDLFRAVCAAVSFAHQQLIIHRDLKPSNVLVTKDGQVKLLDFGIAKLLKTENSGETRTQHLAFTPEYASPEQIRGESLSTATDIYSLGVLLYELLTGNRPFNFSGKNISEIIQTVTESKPPLPSSNSNFKSSVSNNHHPPTTIRRTQLKGDLDNIILKALKTEPKRRYSSVEQFSEDLRRFLQGLPVFARHDTWFYRAGKFTRRNPLLVGAVTLAFLILAGGILTTLYQARNANIEREKAERRFNDVRALANSFIFEIDGEIEKSPIKARELLARKAIEYLDKLAAESKNNVELESELATAYERIGHVQAELFDPGLGKTSDALLSHKKSLEIRERLFAAEPQNIHRGLDVVKSRQFVGDILSMSGQVIEARANYQKNVEFCSQLLTTENGNLSLKLALANSYARLGQSTLRSGTLRETLTVYEEARKIFENLAAENPSDRSLQHSLSIIFSYIGYVKIEQGETGEAIRYFENALELTKKIEDSANIQSRANLSIAHLWLGVALTEHGGNAENLSHLHLALDLQQSVFAADKNNLGEQNGLADCYLELGKALVKAAKTDEAINNLKKAIENYESVWQTDPQNYAAHRQIAYTQIFLANALKQRRDFAKAMDIYANSLEILKKLTIIDPNNTEWQRDIAVCHLRMGETALMINNQISALSHFQTAMPIFEKLLTQSPDHTKIRAEFEETRKQLEINQIN